MKKRINFNIKVNFTNRFIYTFIAFILILIIGIIVFAQTPGVAPNPGHLVNEFAPPAGCLTNQVLQWDGANWVCVDFSSGAGEITEIITGTGLTGGGTSGSVTLSANTSYLQERVTGSCPVGQSIRVIDSSGGVICEVDDTTPEGIVIGSTRTRTIIPGAGFGNCPGTNVKVPTSHDEVHWIEILGSDNVWRISSACVEHWDTSS